MVYDPDIHHRRSIRLRDYDYSCDGAYFVTICTYQRECLLGEIMNRTMRLKEYGRIVQTQWQQLPEHYSGIQLDEFVVMPNHIHGIIEIVGAQSIVSIKTVGEIIRGFKARCTYAINQLRNNPGSPVWQRNYYERVIRDDCELDAIRQYIVENPVKWEEDENNPTRL